MFVFSFFIFILTNHISTNCPINKGFLTPSLSHSSWVKSNKYEYKFYPEILFKIIIIIYLNKIVKLYREPWNIENDPSYISLYKVKILLLCWRNLFLTTWTYICVWFFPIIITLCNCLSTAWPYNSICKYIIICIYVCHNSHVFLENIIILYSKRPMCIFITCRVSSFLWLLLLLIILFP